MWLRCQAWVVVGLLACYCSRRTFSDLALVFFVISLVSFCLQICWSEEASLIQNKIPRQGNLPSDSSLWCLNDNKNWRAAMILVVSIRAIGRWLPYRCRMLSMDQYANCRSTVPKVGNLTKHEKSRSIRNNELQPRGKYDQ